MTESFLHQELGITRLPDGWRVSPLEELLEPKGLAIGVMYPGAHDPEGVPIVRVKNMLNGGINQEDVLRVSEEVEAKHLGARLRGGEVLLSLVGSVGRVAIAPEWMSGWNTARAVAVMRVAKGVSNVWVKTWLTSDAAQHYIQSRLNTTVQATLNLRDVRKIPVVLPPRGDLLAIVGLLGALEDKIALNGRISDTSLELARAAYSNAISVNGEIAELGSCVSLKYGKALREPDRRPGEVPVFGCTGQVGWHDSALTPHKGAVVGRKGANAGWVSWSPRPCWVIDTAFFVDITRLDLSSEVVFLFLETANLPSLVGDSAVPGLNRDAAHAKVVRVPTREAARELSERVSPLMLRSTQTQYESRALAALRDTLLPQLMSGKLRVRDAEKIVEDAV